MIFFEPDLTANPSYNEVNKRNVGLRAVRRAGCTHFMTMDTDEFYDTQQFAAAWSDIVKRNLTHTACNIVSYVTPTLRYRDYESYFVTFICRIDNGEMLRLGTFASGVPCLIDPTRQIPLKRNSRFCILGGIVMHHMTHVRKDVKRKVLNSSASQSEKSKQAMLDKFVCMNTETDKYISVKNQFEIHV